jgi:DNA-binding transcriptional MocR family regulator
MHFNFFEWQSFNEATLKGCSGITVRLAHELWRGYREHLRQGRRGPYAPRQDVLARLLGCCVRSIGRAYAKLRAIGAIITHERWRPWRDTMRQLSNAVVVLFSPDKAKERREMAMTEAQQLALLKARAGEPVPLIGAPQSELMLPVFHKGLPAPTKLSKELVEQGLHRQKSDKSDGPETRILYSESLLTSLARMKGLRKKE